MIIEHENNPSWTTSSIPLNAQTGPIDDMEALLRRYPKVDAEETSRILDYLNKAPIMERGALSARSGMAAKMEQVRRDHAKAFRPSILSYLFSAALVIAVVVTAFAIAG